MKKTSGLSLNFVCKLGGECLVTLQDQDGAQTKGINMGSIYRSMLGVKSKLTEDDLPVAESIISAPLKAWLALLRRTFCRRRTSNVRGYFESPNNSAASSVPSISQVRRCTGGGPSTDRFVQPLLRASMR